jgi:predicted alpha/beta hydrolase
MSPVQTIAVTSSDKHRFNATVYPTDVVTDPVLIFLSALGTPAKVYRHFGREMSKHGVQVCAPDWRGIGSSSIRAGRASDFGYRHLLELDLTALIGIVRQQFPNAPLWLGGHSLGGQLAMLGAAANPAGITGVVLIASGSVHLHCYQGKLRWGVRLLAWLSGLTGLLWGYFPGSRIGFGGREAAGVMRDWSHVAVTGQYHPVGSEVDYENRLRSLRIPVLAITFAADAWSPTLAAKALLGKVPDSTQSHWKWSASDTAGVALDHYSWLKQPTLVAPEVAKHMRRATR